MAQTAIDGRNVYFSDALVASSTAPTVTLRGHRVVNIPDDEIELYLYLWAFNGSTNPASTTSWTVGFVAVEDVVNTPVYLAGIRQQGFAAPLPVVFPAAQAVSGTVTANIGTGSIAAGVNRIAFMAGAGIWYDDSSATLAGGATFTGTSRDATVTATATAWANAATYGFEVRAVSESDVVGDLWVEYSRDNTVWRRAKFQTAAAVTGGGFVAEIIFKPAWRYWRVGYTNGAGAQARFTLGTIAVAA